MACFRVYAFDRTFQLFRSDDLIAPDKESAIARASDLIQTEPNWFAFELWQDARRVHRKMRAVAVAAVSPKLLAAIHRLGASAELD